MGGTRRNLPLDVTILTSWAEELSEAYTRLSMRCVIMSEYNKMSEQSNLKYLRKVGKAEVFMYSSPPAIMFPAALVPHSAPPQYAIPSIDLAFGRSKFRQLGTREQTGTWQSQGIAKSRLGRPIRARLYYVTSTRNVDKKSRMLVDMRTTVLHMSCGSARLCVLSECSWF